MEPPSLQMPRRVHSQLLLILFVVLAGGLAAGAGVGTPAAPAAAAVAVAGSRGSQPPHRPASAGCAIGRSGRSCNRRPVHTVAHLARPFRFFSPHSFWNTPLPAEARVDPRSRVLISDLMRYVRREQADRNGPWINATSNGVSIVTVGANQAKVAVRLNHSPDTNLSAAWSAVPLPRWARPSPGDNDLAVWQPSTDTMWEFFQLHRDGSGWEAEWGGAMRDVTSDPGVYGPGAWPAASDEDESWWGVTAASFPIVGGAMTYDDLKAGQIDHALAIVYPNVRRRTFVSPAQRDDGWSTDPNALPEGTRLRLDPSLNLAKLQMPPLTRMIAQAAQRYGIIVRDQSPVMAFVQQDPTGDPAFLALSPKLTDGLYASQLLASFPWSHLQVMRMDLHQGW
jgi:hypothetical protein